MGDHSTILPITHEYQLACSAEDAFATPAAGPRRTASAREKFGDWPVMLARFAALTG